MIALVPYKKDQEGSMGFFVWHPSPISWHPHTVMLSPIKSDLEGSIFMYPNHLI